MAQINVTDLTFCYEGEIEDIFSNVSFSIDTNWKLGLIGRNGKGKTTFLKLLLGTLAYKGSIMTNTIFDYFPYKVTDEMRKKTVYELINVWKQGCEEWKVMCELDKLSVSFDVLERPFGSLSYGEQTKVMLAILFAGENEFLLIDEPTNHLDYEAREAVKKYLATKKSFILVSHDRSLLDACIDHVLVLNRKSIEVQKGTFSSWWNNKQKRDQFEQQQNQKHVQEIHALKKASEKSARWASKNEGTKIGFDPVKEHDRGVGTRASIGAKTKKMDARIKNYEKRIEREMSAKEGLLQDIEKNIDLKIYPLDYNKETFVAARNLSLAYRGMELPVLTESTFEIKRNEIVFLHGKNGCGKSTLIKAIINGCGSDIDIVSGELAVSSGLKISYVSQDTSWLRGSVDDFCDGRKLDKSLFLAILRQLDFHQGAFKTSLEHLSEGQKKKILIAASLITPAHLYIWDEPLNYIDIFSRIQIERLVKSYKPTMLLVEHDLQFENELASKIITL